MCCKLSAFLTELLQLIQCKTHESYASPLSLCVHLLLLMSIGNCFTSRNEDCWYHSAVVLKYNMEFDLIPSSLHTDFISLWRLDCGALLHLTTFCQKHIIIESLKLGKTSKIMKLNHQPSTTIPAKPCPEVPYLQLSEHLQG